MRIAHYQENGIHVVVPSGSITLGAAASLRRTLVELIEHHRGKGILVNLGGIHEWDTFALQALFAAQMMANKRNIPFALAEGRGRWQKLRKTVKFETVLRHFPTIGVAMAAMNPSAAAPSDARVA